MWVLEAGVEKLSSHSADLSFLCNFNPISSCFLYEQSSVQNRFGFVVLGQWDRKSVVSISARIMQPGPIATWARHRCSVLLLDLFLSAPSLLYLVVLNLCLGWIIDEFPKLYVG